MKNNCTKNIFFIAVFAVLLFAVSIGGFALGDAEDANAAPLELFYISGNFNDFAAPSVDNSMTPDSEFINYSYEIVANTPGYFYVTDGTNNSAYYQYGVGRTLVTFTHENIMDDFSRVSTEVVNYYLQGADIDETRDDAYIMSTADGVTYTYSLASGDTSYYIASGEDVWNNGGEGYSVTAGVNDISFNTTLGIAVSTKTNYYAVGDFNNNTQSPASIMDTVDGITYTFMFDDDAGSFMITDGTNYWRNGLTNYTYTAGRNVISFRPADSYVDVEKVYFYVQGEDFDEEKTLEYRMSTADGETYTFDIVSADTTFYIVAGDETWDNNGENYALPAGRTKITFKPNATTDKMTLEATNYYVLGSFNKEIKDENSLMSTVDGVTYTHEVTSVYGIEYYITDNVTTWNNDGENYTGVPGTILISFVPTTGEVSSVRTAPPEYTLYKISTAEEFVKFAKLCIADEFSERLNVELTADIDLTGYTGYEIMIFGGIFDGNYHTIGGIETSYRGCNVALIRRLEKEGVIRHLYIDVVVTPTGNEQNIGGLVGYNEGIIEDCRVYGYVTGMHSTEA
jgi:hypothetical protein